MEEYGLDVSQLAASLPIRKKHMQSEMHGHELILLINLLQHAFIYLPKFTKHVKKDNILYFLNCPFFIYVYFC